MMLSCHFCSIVKVVSFKRVADCLSDWTLIVFSATQLNIDSLRLLLLHWLHLHVNLWLLLDLLMWILVLWLWLLE
jgi:hypothetical protein